MDGRLLELLDKSIEENIILKGEYKELSHYVKEKGRKGTR